MNWLVYHIVSGHAFFTGSLLLIVAALASLNSRPIAGRVSALAFLIGAIAVVISSTAISYWYYALATAVTLAWIASRYKKSWRRPKACRWALPPWRLSLAFGLLWPVSRGRRNAVVGFSHAEFTSS